MTDTQRKRDPRYTRTVGEKPDLGRRYVENGKVKIEWYEDGKRRSRTIGDNSAKTRRQADEELERLLGLADEEPRADATDEHGDEEVDEMCPDLDFVWLVDEIRGHAEALMDFADDLADSFERGLIKVLDALRRKDDSDEAEESEFVDDADEPVDAEVVEEIPDDESKEAD